MIAPPATAPPATAPPATAPPATAPPATAPPAIALPKGGGAIRGIDEKFRVNPATGTGSQTVPIFSSPGRGGFGPELALRYDSGAGNGPFGLGWSLTVPNISRKTDRGLPRYRDAEASDTFVLTDAEDLVPVLVRVADDWRPEIVAPRTVGGVTYGIGRYRPRTEGSFARIERWTDEATGEAHWRATTAENVTSVYGRSAAGRIADPADARRVFSWLLEETYDDLGNVIRYEYKPDDASGTSPSQPHERNRRGAGYANRYLKRVLYGNSAPQFPHRDGFDRNAWEARNTWHLQVILDYGEHGDPGRPWAETQPWELRPDSFSRYRAGFEMRTQRRCRRAMMFHHFPREAGFGADPTLVRATELAYDATPVFSYLTSVRQIGYVRAADGALRSSSLPPVELAYTLPEIDQQVRAVAPDSLENAPGGLTGGRYRLIDLDGEGLAGILTEQGEGWFYKRNLGAFPRAVPPGHPPEPPEPTEFAGAPPVFTPARLVARMPAVAGQSDPQQQWLDLAGDGQHDLVLLGGAVDGFYERERGDWTRFTPFGSAVRVDWSDPNQRLVDLTGDGHADILITEDLILRWHPALGEEGFGPAEMAARSFDEERGPALILADADQSIYLADMDGDGLSDLVRLRNGEVCYWPNLGYGRFGAKVTMDRAPVFDTPDQFDQRRVRLADVDGSGTTDVIYLGRDGVDLRFNQAGNGWSEATRLTVFPQVDNLTAVTVADLLGNGTACLVWSSALPGDARQPLRYVDLMGGRKPHLLCRVVNNLGAETTLSYAPSTRYYLADEQAGRPWVTRLPFPVHVVEAVEVLDRLSQTRYVTRYAYHHGHFDGQEREFRGFGMVEQWDSDSFPRLAEHDPWPDGPQAGEAEHHLPPVYTKSWFHTGAFLDREAIARHYAAEYYAGDPQGRLLPDTPLPGGLTPEEAREACRALRGRLLRQEVYAADGTAAAAHPYAVTEQTFALRMLQPRQAGRPAVFLGHTREAISQHYERAPADPRIGHSFTLEVDDFGNVTRSAAVAYPRRATISERLPEQARLSITCQEAEFVNRADSTDYYLVNVPYQTRTYEVTGLSPGAADGCFDWAELRQALAAIPPRETLPYEAAPAGDRAQKRLLAQGRTRYYREDLAAPLDWQEIAAPLLPYESYRAVFSRGLLEAVLGPKIGYGELAAVLQGRAGDQGGYVLADGLWWAPSGRQLYAPDDEADAAAYARARFFQPLAIEDPFGQRTRLAFDEPYLLFPTSVEDPLGNLVQAAIDYRVLQPWQITDPNGNRSQAAFDALGMVAGTAVQGKSGEAAGDSLAGFTATLERDTIRAALDAVDPRVVAQPLLGGATTRVVYDLWRYYDTRAEAQPQPNVVWSIAREAHVSDLAPGGASRLQHRFSYSDGLGREILTKMQAEPGPLQVFDAAGARWREEWAGPERQPFDPRWVGTGRTVYNNKGLPIKRYEPFFSASHRFESEAQVVTQGVTPILAYDPLGRLIRTDLPNETLSRVVFDPWQQTSWDGNDTVLESGWYAGRGRPDPATAPEPADPQRRAAWLAAEHAATPSVHYLDSLGRPFLSVSHNRAVRRDAPGRITEIKDYRIPVRTQLDAEGQPLQITDGRGSEAQPGADPLSYADGNVVVRYRYAMGRVRLHQQSMDAGERWALSDVLGRPIRAWDSRGHEFRTDHDALRRPLRRFVRGADAARSDPRVLGREVMFARIEYGEGQGDAAAALNLRTRVRTVHDGAGVVTSEAYDFKGNLLRGSRRLARDYKGVPDWAGEVPLEDGGHTSSTTYDALNRPVTATAFDGSVVRPAFNEAGLLERVDANLCGETSDGEPVWTPFVAGIDYTARGQRERIAYGNGAGTRYTYDPLTFRLIRLFTGRNASAYPDDCPPIPPAGWPGCAVQNLRYTYDPVGNLTRVQDDAQQTIYFRNQRVEPSNDYVYDAVYQLIEATGREHIGQSTQPQTTWSDGFRTRLPHPNVDQAMRRYAERYTFDAAGNILSTVHQAGDGSWTRAYAYTEASLLDAGQVGNRLSATQVGSGPREPYAYDAHGSMTSMPHLPLMRWSFLDQLWASSQQAVEEGTPETTYYVYDAAGQRVRKVTERQAPAVQTPARKDERIYLGGFEVYRQYTGDGAAVTLERETLHLMDDAQRVAMVETRTHGDDGSPARLTRYQLGNHLGSASLELDEAGRIISYEEFFPYGSTSYQAVDAGIKAAEKRYRYTGMERDEETGLAYHGARYLAPWIGRWSSADPMNFLDGLNMFSYVRNCPTKFLDQTGTDSGLPLLLGLTLKDIRDEAYRDFSEEDRPSAPLELSVKENLNRIATGVFIVVVVGAIDSISQVANAPGEHSRIQNNPAAGLNSALMVAGLYASARSAPSLWRSRADDTLDALAVQDLNSEELSGAWSRSGGQIREAERTVALPDVEEIPMPEATIEELKRGLPTQRVDTTRVYRGAGRPEERQVGLRYRNNPQEAPEGDEVFVSDYEAALHKISPHNIEFGSAGSPAVSVSTDLGTAFEEFTKVNPFGGAKAKGVIVYDVPNAVFEKLPVADIGQLERVFYGSIPEKMRVDMVRVMSFPRPYPTGP
jgi:RHS repeat-associated protein